MKCPYCGDQDSKVVDSRHSEDGLSIRRRRECLKCQRRFTTYEIVESLPVIVVKRDGSRQGFDRNKILNSMIRAFDKRKVDVTDLEVKPGEINSTPALIRGVAARFAQLGCTVKGFDAYVVILDSEGKQQLVYKHAISTIIPVKPISILDAADRDDEGDR